MNKKTPNLDKLFEDIKRLCQEHGDQKVLAGDIGVNQQQLHDWISRRFSPNGEIALRMRIWADAKMNAAPSIESKKSTKSATVNRDKK